ncbi:primosomal protein N' [Shewanella sp. SNU WT4]|uniref:primosomal protein N' n=1 Tax=Shewanella sp. SNU WT4 TaxID=2590015 RepID=UPI0011291651|nr:primosomal protein N' [Shewanella sp. SNU WT4]QDF68655.1 primosomal protein N' [Shewanella sp. SNU WT4]
MEKFAEVALPVPMRQNFSYRLTSQQAIDAKPGCRVRVPFGRQQLIGIIAAITDHCNLPTTQIKSVTSLLDLEPLLAPPLLQLIERGARYYLASLGQMLTQALPTALRKGASSDANTEIYYQLTAAGQALKDTDFKRATSQLKIWQTLSTDKLAKEQCQALGLSAPSLKTMEQKGWLETIEVAPIEDLSWRDNLILLETPLHLNTEQAVAVAAINSRTGFYPSLIEGITGSGKTEVYLSLLEKVLAAGKQALILVPEIGLTPQTIDRFRSRFKVHVAVIHSGLTDNQRLHAWQKSRSGEAAIIIGTRSALFTPMRYPGIIILDEEHDSSFKQQEGVGYHARDLAVMRAQLEQIPVVLGSATPSLETLNNALSGRYGHLSLNERAGKAKKVRQGIIDIRNQPLNCGMSSALINEMRLHLDAGNQVLLFLNRRGFAPALICHECGHLHECDRCDAFFTVHQALNEICCHHCGNQHPIPKQCHQCGSTMLAGQGIGTEQLEQTLAGLFPQYPVVRIDRDSTRLKGSLERHLGAIHRGEFKILVGTQMLAKGHHFPDVTLVGLLDVDGALFSADFRAPERFGQLYTQVAGRAGRAAKPGTVLLQTHQHDNPLLKELLHKGYGDFARQQLQERAMALLPPVWHMVLVRAEAHRAEDADALLNAIANLLPHDREFEIIGPLPAPLDRKAGKFRRQLMFQAKDRQRLQRECERILPLVTHLPETKRCRWSFDRDPQDLL